MDVESLRRGGRVPEAHTVESCIGHFQILRRMTTLKLLENVGKSSGPPFGGSTKNPHAQNLASHGGTESSFKRRLLKLMRRPTAFLVTRRYVNTCASRQGRISQRS